MLLYLEIISSVINSYERPREHFVNILQVAPDRLG